VRLLHRRNKLLQQGILHNRRARLRVCSLRRCRLPPAHSIPLLRWCFFFFFLASWVVSRVQDAKGRWHDGAIAAAVENVRSAVVFTAEGAPAVTVQVRRVLLLARAPQRACVRPPLHHHSPAVTPHPNPSIFCSLVPTRLLIAIQIREFL
jgi:hypothetical protein